jgi:hypothetical protein
VTLGVHRDLIGSWPHPVAGLQVRAQEQMFIGENEDLEFKVDLLVTDAATGQP